MNVYLLFSIYWSTILVAAQLVVASLIDGFSSSSRLASLTVAWQTSVFSIFFRSLSSTLPFFLAYRLLQNY